MRMRGLQTMRKEESQMKGERKTPKVGPCQRRKSSSSEFDNQQIQ